MKISIITPSYKQLEYIKLCAASVADQQCDFKFEHLIEDACSGPDFDQWANDQSFASVRSQQDRGMYDAINNGFERAKGEILAWLNCDEQYLPGTLQKVSDWFDLNPDKDVLFGDVILVNQEGVPISYRTGHVPWVEHIKHCFLTTYSAGMFVRRRVLDKVGGLDVQYRDVADADWVLNFLNSKVSCGVLNEGLSTFLQYEGNMGQQEFGGEELRKWKVKVGGDSRFRAMLWSCAHRLRKTANGEYWKRDVSVYIYRPEMISRQQKVSQVSGRWKYV
ncbi:glycosyltransferase [Rubritalea marina]|uniref:glycosyltransferase n=1 Tax=Rubritalea marina TaxID=361055 RepID=UPI00035CCABC|nr:glycosyltransferase [Rubritalea marina]